MDKSLALIISAIVIILALCVWGMVKADQRFEANLKVEYAKCIASKETEYTCRTYITSMRAEHESEIAAGAAIAAVGVSAAQGRKR